MFISWSGKVSALIMGVATALTLKEMFWGPVRLHRMTWFLFSILGFIVMVSYARTGQAGESIWIARAAFYFPLALFIASWWRGESGWSPFELRCIDLVSICVCLWVFLRSDKMAMYMGLAIDFLALSPTLRKVAERPESESATGWLIGSAACVLNLFSIEHWSWVSATEPVYLLATNAIVTVLAMRPSKASEN